jgi:signal peptidase I
MGKIMKPIRSSLLVTLGVVATIRAASPLTVTTVLGHSMEPTLRPGGSYVLDRGYYRSHALVQGDIVVFRKAGETYIKRVYALPGDRLWLLKADDGSGDLILEPWEAARFQRAHPGSRLPYYHVVSLAVAPGQCYVLGDNSVNSIDSRQFGPVPMSSILGRVMQ